MTDGKRGCGMQVADEPEACSAGTFDSAFTKAFLKTDEEFGKADNAALVGTTAVVALVGDRQLYIGNCGARPGLSREPPQDPHCLSTPSRGIMLCVGCTQHK